ncbi:MAG: glutamate--tRNA ligase, partial [Clostridia bacterium]|nr:glutamate--tRNA ligase [Clostridia bacterium]
SERGEIYRCFAKKLLDEGLAYPCFCSEDTLAATREKQEAEKQRTGYYGQWASCRNLDESEAIRRAMAGEPFVVRLKSPGSEQNRIFFEDGIKGKIEMPENDEDFVILKSDGIPTYHFAHAVDDHLMRTTHVIRGDEWISSTPKHIQLFKLLGFKAPKYAHVAPLMKPDGAGKRKISKRKDPEAAVHFFIQQGLPESAIIEYFMSIAASDFEDWRRANPTEDISKFKFNLKKMSVSGALFDGAKLNDISKNLISAMDTDTVVNNILTWAQQFDPDFYAVLSKDIDFTKQVFGIDRGGAKPRKDLSKWSDAKDYCAYFFDEYYENSLPLPEKVAKEDAITLLAKYSEIYSTEDDKQQWFEKIKAICPDVNFATDMKAYKQNPDAYRGNAGDAASVIRSAITGRLNTPDLCSIMQVLGKEKCLERIAEAIETLKNN